MRSGRKFAISTFDLGTFFEESSLSGPISTLLRIAGIPQPGRRAGARRDQRVQYDRGADRSRRARRRASADIGALVFTVMFRFNSATRPRLPDERSAAS